MENEITRYGDAPQTRLLVFVLDQPLKNYMHITKLVSHYVMGASYRITLNRIGPTLSLVVREAMKLCFIIKVREKS